MCFLFYCNQYLERIIYYNYWFMYFPCGVLRPTERPPAVRVIVFVLWSLSAESKWFKYALSQNFYICSMRFSVRVTPAWIHVCCVFSCKQLFVMMAAKTLFLTHLFLFRVQIYQENVSNLASSPCVSTRNWQITVFLCNFVRHMKKLLFFWVLKTLKHTFFWKCLSTCWGCEHWSAWVEVLLLSVQNHWSEQKQITIPSHVFIGKVKSVAC